MIWLGIAGLTLLILALLLVPLWRGRCLGIDSVFARRAVFAAQLAELEREAAEGTMSAADLAAGRLELQRRLLAADKDAPAASAAQPRSLWVCVFLLVGVPFLALLFYSELGAPSLRDQPARLRPEIATEQGEGLVTAANGQVTLDAAAAFERALILDPQNPKARYYLALAKAQAGDLDGAIAAWQALLALAAPQAPWRKSVEMSIAEAARMTGRNPADLGVSSLVDGVDRVDEQAIVAMVTRLEARLQTQSDDVDGWLRLGKSWEALGNKEKSLAAYDKAAKAAPLRADVLLAYARALYPPESDQPPPLEFIALLRQVLALEPEQFEALWFVGQAELDAGNRVQAKAMWQKLRDRLPAGSPPRKAVEAALEKLG